MDVTGALGVCYGSPIKNPSVKWALLRCCGFSPPNGYIHLLLLTRPKLLSPICHFSNQFKPIQTSFQPWTLDSELAGLNPSQKFPSGKRNGKSELIIGTRSGDPVMPDWR